ncbi:MAG: hypothetical protein AB1349_11310 [Elusimicrobiota bacterium]
MGNLQARFCEGHDSPIGLSPQGGYKDVYSTKIRIYTIDGKHIKTLEETNGNKSIELYPIQENIPSGIYLYGTNNPGEKNMGKFTVIR